VNHETTSDRKAISVGPRHPASAGLFLWPPQLGGLVRQFRIAPKRSPSLKHSSLSFVPAAVPPLRTPMRGVMSCCARAASGHAAAPPRSVMNERLGLPEAKGSRTNYSRSGPCIAAKRSAHVRFGSFTTEAVEATPRCMSASPRKRTNSRGSRHVRLVPLADISAASFDHLVVAREER
jgi:hypothetical protein